MTSLPYLPVFELSRGLASIIKNGLEPKQIPSGEETIESIHFGAAAVVDATGKLLAWYGNPHGVTYLRSSAKPFQAMPFIERGGPAYYGLSPRQVALICSSHSGTDEHVKVVKEIQEKTGVMEKNLLCGIHPLHHESTIDAMRQRAEPLTSNRHNCSGKHTGMIAYARMENLPFVDYINPQHPIQRTILDTFAEMCNLPYQEVFLGTDGCSAPNFAVPLYNAALAYARLADPDTGKVVPTQRVLACQAIFNAMTTYPDMVGGPGRFDTVFMQTTHGRIVAKGGAEGFQALGIAPNQYKPGFPGVGIALKVSDGDYRDKICAAVSLEILRQLDCIRPSELETLSVFGPTFPLYNWQQLPVGYGRPQFNLEFPSV
jgi:L-asparaginase II